MAWLVFIGALLVVGGAVAVYFIIKRRKKEDERPETPAEYDRPGREATILAQKAMLVGGAVVFIGDSRTEHLGSIPAPFPTLNAAISGVTVSAYYPFLNQLLDGLQAKIVVIALGVNDAWSQTIECGHNVDILSMLSG